MLRFFPRYKSCSGLVIFLAAIALFVASPAFSQQSSATINGIVQDQSSAVVEGATVALTNLDTTVSRNSVSNASGDYVFINVLPGVYSLKVSKPGFGTQTQQPVRLEQRSRDGREQRRRHHVQLQAPPHGHLG